jgi:glyoxylase-like metal-dependent hydrolase (beta-lactamase superfamily II)
MRINAYLLLVVLLSGAGPASTVNASDAELSLTRLDCGGSGEPEDIGAFSDTHAYDGKKLLLRSSCYLIQHGSEYLLWDAGIASAALDDAGKKLVQVSLLEQLAKLEIAASAITYVGISHFHEDHTGQADAFLSATLLIGAADWDELIRPRSDASAVPHPMEHWLKGRAPIDKIRGDKDVFGDGSVVMLATPGHSAGHHSLLVRLKRTGNVMLTGDLAIFRENYAANEVPGFNPDRAATLASLDRFKRMAANLHATVVIQHDPRDIKKLPAFPAAAK